MIKRFRKKLKENKKRSAEKKLRKRTKHYVIDDYLAKAGITVHSNLVRRGLFKLCLALNLVLTGYLIYFFVQQELFSVYYIIGALIAIWTLVFVLSLAVIWLAFYLFVDLRIFKRKLSIEEVFPDFLFLTATNIRSGMTTDKALWFAVRPRFGVLANEIEKVAKEVMSGTELTESLEGFAQKYQSDIINRSISLLIEGIKSGGEIGDLLNRIASNIQESRLMRKEMAADVTTYVIFITFAAVIAAPVLLALAYQLINIIVSIVSNIDMPSTANMMFAITDISIQPRDFKIFAYASLVITSFFSAIIIATIKKGSIKEGIKYIPMFIIVSVILFLLASKVLGSFLGGFFV